MTFPLPFMVSGNIIGSVKISFPFKAKCVTWDDFLTHCTFKIMILKLQLYAVIIAGLLIKLQLQAITLKISDLFSDISPNSLVTLTQHFRIQFKSLEQCTPLSAL